eukprot:jgi/Orpsp1_1/1176693/evm.model.c7180000058635.1
MESIIGKNALETITSLTNIPIITGARVTTKSIVADINPSGKDATWVEINYTTKFKDQEKNKVRLLQKNISGVVGKGQVFTPLSNFFSQEVHENVVKTCPSPSGTRMIVLKSNPVGSGNGDKKDKEYIVE